MSFKFGSKCPIFELDIRPWCHVHVHECITLRLSHGHCAKKGDDIHTLYIYKAQHPCLLIVNQRKAINKLEPDLSRLCISLPRSCEEKTMPKPNPTSGDVLLYYPNLIGYARISLMLASFVYAKSNWQVSVFCYGLAFFGDLVDGFVARKFNQCSPTNI